MSCSPKFPRLALMAGMLLVSNAQAGEAAPAPMAQHCLDAMGMQELQPIREMAGEMSPEVILDRVFSAVAPDFQNALLSRSAEAGKKAKRQDAPRDPNYYLPAIATMAMPFNWIRMRADGRVIEPAAAAANADPNWKRASDRENQVSALPAPQRY